MPRADDEHHPTMGANPGQQAQGHAARHSTRNIDRNAGSGNPTKNQVKIEDCISSNMKSVDGSKVVAINFVMQKNSFLFMNPDTPQLRSVIKKATVGIF